MTQLKTLCSSIWAGMCIALGGTVYLSVENNVVGALFFTVGLFTICVFGLNLFTGKVCYLLDRKAGYLFDLALIWVGNLIGTFFVAAIEQFTRIGTPLQARAAAICSVKLSDSPVSLFILGVLCNILICIAVDGFSLNRKETGAYLALFFGVAVFILCGFEHSVADMYYLSIAQAWSWPAIQRLLVITAGNMVGGILFYTAISKWR